MTFTLTIFLAFYDASSYGSTFKIAYFYLHSIEILSRVHDPIVLESDPGLLQVVPLWPCSRIFFKSPNLKVTLQPFDIQRPTVPLLKDLNVFTKHSYNL